jgi:hypothetical protein
MWLAPAGRSDETARSESLEAGVRARNGARFYLAVCPSFLVLWHFARAELEDFCFHISLAVTWLLRQTRRLLSLPKEASSRHWTCPRSLGGNYR